MASPPSATVSVFVDTFSPGVSSSASVAVTSAMLTLAYSPAPLAVWAMVASPWSESSSSAAVTDTVCAVFQLLVVKVSAAEETLRSLSPLAATPTVTAAVGSVSSTTV